MNENAEKSCGWSYGQKTVLSQIAFLRVLKGIVKLSEFEQNLGNTPIHNPLIVKHSGCRPKAEKQPNLT